MLTTPGNPPCQRCGAFLSEHVGSQRRCPTHTGDRFRRRPEDLPRLGVAPHDGVGLGSYVHVRDGGRYEVVGGALDARDDSALVLYQDAHGALHVREPLEFAARFVRWGVDDGDLAAGDSSLDAAEVRRHRARRAAADAALRGYSFPNAAPVQERGSWTLSPAALDRWECRVRVGPLREGGRPEMLVFRVVFAPGGAGVASTSFRSLDEEG